MKRHKSLFTLSHDHHHGLIAAQVLKKNAPKYEKLPTSFEGKTEYILKFYEEELVPHFDAEEKILFPFVKGRDNEIDLIIKDLISEHNKMSEYISAIKKNEHDENLMDELAQLLDGHIRKEERILFEKIQEKFENEELEKIQELLEK